MARRLLHVLIAVLSCVGAHALASASPPPASAWGHAKSDLAPDPAVRFGVLANGMRYAVMRNATPAGQASLRLRIGAGSLEESDAQQGLAHLLEHMSFKGSTHVPSGEMVRILQRDGLAFGPDTNASTEWTQTVYMLDLPKADADTLASALMLMRETAGELTLDGGALDAERGVVLSEERLRDTPQYRAEKAQLDLLAHGQLAARRFPIGQVEVIEHAPASLLREFYRANYRPGRATLIAVGDFDPAAMEAQIKARFGDWTPVGPPTDPPSLGEVEARGLTVKVVRLPGFSTQTVIAWARPYDASPDTAVRRRRELVEGLTLAVLNRRLDSLARGERPPFLEAGGAFQNLLRSAKVSIVQAESAPGAWRGALEAIETEVRRLVSHGVRAEELDREIVQARAAMRNAAAGAATRPTPELASNLVEAADQEAVFRDEHPERVIDTVNRAGLRAGSRPRPRQSGDGGQCGLRRRRALGGVGDARSRRGRRGDPFGRIYQRPRWGGRGSAGPGRAKLALCELRPPRNGGAAWRNRRSGRLDRSLRQRRGFDRQAHGLSQGPGAGGRRCRRRPAGSAPRSPGRRLGGAGGGGRGFRRDQPRRQSKGSIGPDL